MKELNDNTPIRNTDQFTLTAFAAIMQKLGGIDKKLEQKIAYWKCDEAVDAFMEYVSLNHKCPDNFVFVMSKFRLIFNDKNIAEIIPNEIQGFLLANWHNASPSTYNKRKVQLSTFFNYCIKELKRQGSPNFHNPCDLIDSLKETPKARSGLIPIGKMGELLNTFTEPRQWLQIAVQFTSGLRIGEVLKLRPMDIQGRILTLVEPKSGRDEESAVIPVNVAYELGNYVKYMNPDELIFPVTRQSANRLLKRHAKTVGLELSTHDLRRWCATFWERQGDISMMRFVLRHSGVKDSSGGIILTSLAGRYVANLSPEEAMKRQDSSMPSELFNNISAS